ncbi:hypothetical protein ASZ90_016018 [hydrocarbon metagenome]|uniref:Uncharacterized protein n=1 Tax=hydrocarbon metagenome TaxID=938273 RepID=A0A0W8F0E9_9ZZZZ
MNGLERARPRSPPVFEGPGPAPVYILLDPGSTRCVARLPAGIVLSLTPVL